MASGSPRSGWSEMRKRLVVLSILVTLLLSNELFGGFVSERFKGFTNVLFIILLSLMVVYFVLVSKQNSPQRGQKELAIDEITKRVIHWQERRANRKGLK
jgi:hypothetical protein